jgi:hypothetical protein
VAIADAYDINVPQATKSMKMLLANITTTDNANFHAIPLQLKSGRPLMVGGESYPSTLRIEGATSRICPGRALAS